MPLSQLAASSSAPVRFRLFAIAIAACSLAIAPSAQPQGAGFGSRNIISPSVIENAFVHQDGPGTWTLDLLILWRGAPGWFLAGGRSGTSGSGVPGQRTIMHNRDGGVDYDIVFDAGAGVARLAGAVIRLDETNVVLVDGMPRGMKVVGTRKVNSRIERPPIGLQAVYRGNREIDAFLRCTDTGGNPDLDRFRSYCTWPPGR